MKKKLTLTIEEDAVRRMKRIAQRRKTSVSALFEQWSAQNTDASSGHSLLGERLKGKWQNDANVTEGDSRLAYLLEKHANFRCKILKMRYKPRQRWSAMQI